KTDPNASKLEGLDFHIADWNGPKEYADDEIGVLNNYVKMRKSDVLDGEVPQEAKELVYSYQFAKKFATDQDRINSTIYNNLKNAPAEGSGFRAWESLLEGWDHLTSQIKKNQLLFSHRWVVNNYLDNIQRAYQTDGLSAAFKLLPPRILNQNSMDTLEDLNKLYNPKSEVVKLANLKSNNLPILLNKGIIEQDIFKSLGKETIEAIDLHSNPSKFFKDAIESIKGEERSKFSPLRVIDAINSLAENTVGRIGSISESMSRLVTAESQYKKLAGNESYVDNLIGSLGIGKDNNVKRAVEAIKKNDLVDAMEAQPQLTNAILDDAAAVVKKAFFNYADVTDFERKVMKRIFPYYTFYSKNLGFWTRELFDNYARANKLDLATRRAFGERLNNSDAWGTPAYAREGAVVRVEDGDKQSTFDSIDLVNYAGRSLQPYSDFFSNTDKATFDLIHPMLKAFHNVYSNQSFPNQVLFPSTLEEAEDYKKQRVLYKGGLPYLALGIPQVNTDYKYRDADSGEVKTWPTPTKYPQTDSDWFSALYEFMAPLFPSIVNDLFDYDWKIRQGVRDHDESLDRYYRNLFLPLKANSFQRRPPQEVAKRKRADIKEFFGEDLKH
ncbi:MAG: hypothetical protein HQK52_19515, partial [Oligoflexia bacterium]|nr:hypothetical protein [Oligoflexia bacterium]